MSARALTRHESTRAPANGAACLRNCQQQDSGPRAMVGRPMFGLAAAVADAATARAGSARRGRARMLPRWLELNELHHSGGHEARLLCRFRSDSGGQSSRGPTRFGVAKLVVLAAAHENADQRSGFVDDSGTAAAVESIAVQREVVACAAGAQHFCWTVDLERQARGVAHDLNRVPDRR